MSYLVVVRHGQTDANVIWRFSGRTNVPLNETGIQQAKEAARKIDSIVQEPFDYAYSSEQQRAIRTMEIMLGTMFDSSWFMFPQLRHVAALNERHYGDMEGMTKDEAEEKFGKQNTYAWRKTYDGRPPNGQSLSDVHALVKPWFRDEILPKLAQNKNLLVVGHGNTLRTLVLEVEKLPTNDVEKIWLDNADPWIYRYENGKFTRK